MFLRISLVFLSLALVACSSPARKPQEQAIFHALVHDATLRTLVQHCNEVSKSSEQEAWKAQKEWWKRNGAFVEAADYGFSYNMINFTGNRQETGARYAMALTFDVVDEAENRVSETLKEGVSEEACIAALLDYRDGNKDLSDNKELYSLLLNLVQQKKSRGPDLLLQQAELDIEKGKKYSRSSITAERLAIRTVCPGAVVHTLKANWPLEIFEASCPDKSYVLVECEWGNCKVR